MYKNQSSLDQMCSRDCNYGNLCCHKRFIVLWLRGGAEAKIEMNGDKNKSIVQQSAGLHLIEVNNSGDCKGSWSYAEYAVVLRVFVLILKCSHLCHYCLLTKKLVNSKVAKVGIQMKDLSKQPTDVVIIPGI